MFIFLFKLDSLLPEALFSLHPGNLTQLWPESVSYMRRNGCITFNLQLLREYL
jgi:hypothetical protein